MTVRPITTVLVAATAEQGAGPYDLTDLATLKLELSITDNSQDAWLQSAISQVSLVIANYCNRVFPVETIQDAIYYQMDPYPYQVPGGNEPLTLSRFPLVIGAPFSGAISGPGASTITGVSASGLAVGQPLSQWNPNPRAGQPLTAALPPGATISGVSGSAPSITVSFTAPNDGVALAGGTLMFVPGVSVSVADPTANPLIANQDFVVDAKNGQVMRIWSQTGYPMKWEAAPTTIQYQAGYAEIPLDLVDATLRLLTARYRARGRDPLLRSEGDPGVGQQQFWVGSPAGQKGAFPAEIQAILDNYRVPVTA